jgi:hypothetical protein
MTRRVSAAIRVSWRERAESVARELQNRNIRVEPGKAKLLQTRRDMEHGCRTVSQILEREGQTALAAAVNRYVERMPPLGTKKDRIVEQLRGGMRAKRIDDQQPIR